MLAAGVRVAVGTDSRATNPDLELWRDLCFAAATHPHVAADAILKLGTLAAAEKIVSVGRGIGEQEQIEVVEQLAKAMGAELAASRPICDEGWLPMERQIGSSGQTVAPKLYLALGIIGGRFRRKLLPIAPTQRIDVDVVVPGHSFEVATVEGEANSLQVRQRIEGKGILLSGSQVIISDETGCPSANVSLNGCVNTNLLKAATD